MRYRLAMVASDEAIGRLEELNLRGRGTCAPDAGTRAAIDHALAVLPAGAQVEIKPSRTVQQALDRMFALQEVLQEEQCRQRGATRLNADTGE